MLLILGMSDSLIAQVEQTSSVNYVNVSGDNAYVLDSITYDNTALLINRGVTLDSAALRVVVAADTLVSTSNISTYTTSYNRSVSRLAALQSVKTSDSLRMVYWAARLAQQKIVIDSIVAN